MPVNYRVSLLGNFTPFSTETEWSLAFELLGWEVVRIQENNCNSADIVACQPDLLWWVHTHTFTPRGHDMFTILRLLKERGIPTVSVHLDTFRGLAQLDNREARVGVEPFWKTDFVFTTDGSCPEFFEERGVRHFWIEPAVGDRHCWLGNPDPLYMADVIFIGSRGYHPEYQFRERLCRWLDGEHGYKVRRYGGDREHVREKLNDVIASAKIVVGDSCFAGTPRTYSDRISETQGRGGFLVHPPIEGANLTGYATYKAGDLDDLDQVIQYYLSHDEERDRMRLEGFEWCKQHHTCSTRVLQILNKVTELSGVRLN